MQDAVDIIDRVFVRGRLRSLETAALVDGDVDEHGARLHRLQLLARDQLRGRCARDQNCADYEVSFLHGRIERGLGGVHRLDQTVELGVELSETVVVAVEDGNVSAHADSDLSSIGA